VSAVATASPKARRTPVALSDIDLASVPRIATSMAELDRVLGGGAVPASVVLLGGDPGIGKSTLLMQALLGMARAGRAVLYATGEESTTQVAGRAERLGGGASAMLLATTELDDVCAAMQTRKYDAVVVDSIQTLRAAALSSTPGSAAHLREVAARLTEVAKSGNAVVFVIGHVTKDGMLAGPKLLEHMVDTVLSFEGDGAHRMVRVRKNRFGPAQELAVYEMRETGLREVEDPSAAFLAERASQSAGSVLVPIAEGTRPLMVEVQALVAPALYGAPRRVVSGLDSNRLAVLLAVLQRKAGVHVLDQDVFASVAGGLRVDEPAADLALCAAVVSSLRDKPLAQGALAFGEVGLAGELRSVPRAEARLTVARDLGLQRAVVPAANAAHDVDGIEVVPAATLDEALRLLF
jgi:DNA repair protein RadA/Sms